MGDPNMEWEIQEYSPSKEGEVTVVRWIFNKGLWLGKKVVITGVAISSAPLVLPPLVVYSALGFAFSVPFGLVFASYACTNKLMNKLLPTPEPSPMLEYYTDEDEEEGNKGFGKIVMEEDEKELEDTKRGVGMRIYLNEDDDYWQKDVDSWEEQPIVFNDENVEEEGYEEDVGEYVEGEDDCTHKIEMRDENQGEDYIEYIDENVEEEGYIGKYVEGENDFTQTIEMIDENQGDEYKEYIDENVEEKGYEDDVGMYVEDEDDYTQKLDMRDKNQEEEYKGFIGETVEVGDDNVEGIEVREDDREELVNQRSNDEEQLGEISRIAVVVGGNKEKHENDGEVKELNLVVRVKGAVEIKDELAGNRVKIGLDEIEPLVMGINIDKEEYNEDAGEYMEGEDDFMEGAEKEIEVREEGDRQKLVGEKGNDEAPVAEIRKVVILVPGNENTDNAREREEIDLVPSEVRGGNGNEKETIDNEDIVEESTGLLEKIRDKGNVGNNVTEESDDAKEMRGIDENEEGKSTIIRDPIGDPLEDDDVLLKKLVEEVKETGERERAVEETPISFEGGDLKLEKPSEKIENINQTNQERNVLDIMAEQVGEAQDKGLGNGNGNTVGYVNGKLATKSSVGNLDSTKEQKPETQETLVVLKERAADNNKVDQVEDLISKKRENIISSNADMREIADESGFDLFDDRNMPIGQKLYPTLQVTAKDDFSEGTTEVNVDYMALPTSTRMFDSSYVKNALKKDEVPSSQVQLKEEEKKIWEQIDAMRAIVGYKVDCQPTCIQELEALYIFTGVEPPASFKDPSDLSDVNHKLRFLMSIVGVR